MFDVFISYRRAQSRGYALWVECFLKNHAKVFLDSSGIEPGAEYRDRISSVLGECLSAIIIIDPQWMTICNPDGNPRIADPDDLVHQEVRLALANSSLSVLPLLVEAAQMPREDDLPPALVALGGKNALTLGLDAESVERSLSKRIIELCRETPCHVEAVSGFDILPNYKFYRVRRRTKDGPPATSSPFILGESILSTDLWQHLVQFAEGAVNQVSSSEQTAVMASISLDRVESILRTANARLEHESSRYRLAVPRLEQLKFVADHSTCKPHFRPPTVRGIETGIHGIDNLGFFDILGVGRQLCERSETGAACVFGGSHETASMDYKKGYLDRSISRSAAPADVGFRPALISCEED